MKTMTRKGYRSLLLAVLLLLLLLLVSAGTALAADLYALGAKVPILAEPKLGAAKVGEARRGDLLSGGAEEQGWYPVTFAGKNGWVSRMLVGSKAPTKVISVLNENDTDDLEGSARRRASSFTTAAAARGLSEERTRLSQKYQVDYSGLAWIERHEVSPEEGLPFVESKEKR